MTGFRHDIAGGNGNLIATSVQSPNFETGVQGWQIRKDGSVEFNDGTFRGTITAGTFEGNDFVINSAGEFFYNGTPAVGNLAYSVVPGINGDPNVSDPFGNEAPAGSTFYEFIMGVGYFAYNTCEGATTVFFNPTSMAGWSSNQTALFWSVDTAGSSISAIAAQFFGMIQCGNVLQLYVNQATPPAPGAGCDIYPDTIGNPSAITANGFTGQLDLVARAFGAGQTVNSTSFTNLLSVLVGVGKYKFDVMLYIQAASSAGQWQIALNGPATSSLDYNFRYVSNGGVIGQNVARSAYTTLSGPNPSVAGGYWVELHGVATTTTAGHLVLSGATTVAADTWQLDLSSVMEVRQVG